MNILAVEVNLICCEETVKALIGQRTATAEKQFKTNGNVYEPTPAFVIATNLRSRACVILQ